MVCKCLRLRAPEEALCRGSSKRYSVQLSQMPRRWTPGSCSTSRFEPGVRELVWTLNQTDLVETLTSCQGHPEDPYWWETTGGTAYVLCVVTSPSKWNSGAGSVAAASRWLEGGPTVSTRWPGAVAGVSSQPCTTGIRPQSLGPRIGQANELIKEYLDHDVVALTSVRRGQEDHARQSDPQVLLRGSSHG